MISRGRTLDLVFGGLAAAELGLAAWLAPTGDSVTLANGRPLGGLCIMHNLFGVDCPFCGMTRSFVALAHGHVGAAFRFHPAGPLLALAMLVFVFAVAAVAVRKAQPLVERKRFLFAYQTVAIVCIALGVLKLVRS